MMEFPEYDATDTYKCRHDISKMIYPTTQQPIYILKNLPARSQRLPEGRVRPAAVANVAADAAPAKSEAAASPVGSLGRI